MVFEGTGAFILSLELCRRRRRRQAYDIAIPSQALNSWDILFTCLFFLFFLILDPNQSNEKLSVWSCRLISQKINLQNSTLALLPYLNFEGLSFSENTY